MDQHIEAWHAITPTDGGSANAPCGILITGAGDVTGKCRGVAVTFPAVPAWTFLEGNWTEVSATGTTASGIMGASL